jgi:hypothetical protein
LCRLGEREQPPGLFLVANVAEVTVGSLHDDEVLEHALHRHELANASELAKDRPGEVRRRGQGGKGGCDKLRFLERHVGFLKFEPRNPACRCSRVPSRVTVGEDHAQGQSIPKAEPAHCLRCRDRVEGAAAFDRSLELVPKGALRSHERMFA